MKVSSYGNYPLMVLSIAIICMCIMACTEHETITDYEKPSISIDTCEVMSSNSCEVTLSVNLGMGFAKHRVYLDLYNMSEQEQIPTTVNVPIGSERSQKVTVKLNVPKEGHVYGINAILETDANRFMSNRTVVYFIDKNYMSQYGAPFFMPSTYDNYYMFLSSGIGMIVVKGGTFTVHISSPTGSWPKGMEIKLRDVPIAVEPSTSFSAYKTTYAVVKLPNSIEAGDYTVSAWLDGKAMNCMEKLRVLPWVCKTSKTECPDVVFSTDGTFRLGNRMYYLQKNQSTHRTRCCSYDYENREWTMNKEFEGTCLYATECGDKGYCITEEGKVMRYDEGSDEWTVMCDAPAEENKMYRKTLFSVNGSLYFGGGYYLKNIQICYVHDLWQLDVNTGSWSKACDIPYSSNPTSSCSTDDVSYVFLDNRQLWKYNAREDNWTEEAPLNAGPLYQDECPIVMKDGKIVKVGVHNVYDVSEYDPETRKWTLKGLNNFLSYNGYIHTPAITVFNDEIYVGPQKDYGHNDDYSLLKIKTYDK